MAWDHRNFLNGRDFSGERALVATIARVGINLKGWVISHNWQVTEVRDILIYLDAWDRPWLNHHNIHNSFGYGSKLGTPIIMDGEY